MDLDSLLADLENTSSGSVVEVAPVVAPSQQPGSAEVDELENLMNDLDLMSNGSSAPAPAPAVKPVPVAAPLGTFPPAGAAPATTEIEVDDLDALINNLDTSPAAAAVAPASKPANDMDDLDALISGLDAPAPVAAAPAPKPVLKPATVTVTATAAPSSGTDDLDDLLGELDVAAAAPAPAAAAAPAPKPALKPATVTVSAPAPAAAPADALDDLLGELDMATAPAAAAPAAAAAPKPAAAATADALDDLLGELDMAGTGPAGSAAAAAAAPKPAAAAPPQANPYGGMGGRDEIDTLLGGLSSDMSNITPASSGPMGGGGSGPVRGMCGRCGQPIRGECINAMGRMWHPEHFVCATCQQPIGTRTFYESNGQPNCDRCWKNLFCPRCAHCDQPIAERCITALGKKWHPEHFICSQCLQPLNAGFFAREGKPFCEKCFYGAFSAKCAGCNQPIRGECINALGQKWHPDHFTCFYCHKAFSDGAFFEYQGKPYCETHYHLMTGEVCAACNRPVGNRSITAMGKKWHPEHFVCAFCNNMMNSGSYKENDGKPYCGSCYTKLFG